MSEQETPMDALDQRLANYLNGRAEMAAALGPGPDHVASLIAPDAGRAAFPGRRGVTGLRGIPTLAWALLVMGLLAAMALALAAGSDRDNGLVVLPPASPVPFDPAAVASPLRGTWTLDPTGSGIDATYGGPGNSQPGGPVVFDSMLWLGSNGAMRVWTGFGGGCETDGTWQATGEQVNVMLPTSQSGCELTGPGPEARVIRERLAAAATFDLDGTTLTFRDQDGRPALVYWKADWAMDTSRSLGELGELALDLSASGIDPTVSSGWVVSGVTSFIAFDGTDGIRITTAVDGESCDDAAGTYVNFARLAIDVPALSGHCGDGPTYPDLEVRRMLSLVGGHELWDEGELRLLDLEGNVLLVYRPRPEAAIDPASIEGAWWLDFEASGIDDSYGGGRAPQNGLRFLSGIAFEPGGGFRVASGAGGGCETTGTWQVEGGRLGVDVPTGEDGCESRGPGPAALEIRQRVARAEQVVLRGTRLTLLDASGDRLLVFERSTNGALWGPVQEGYERRWQLDFEASGIEGSYPATSGRKRSTTPVASSIEFADGVVSGGTGAGGGCDHFEGTYSDADGRFSIDLPAAAGHCGSGPVFPDLEVRKRLADTAAWQVDGETLRLLDADGALLLLYRHIGIETT